LQFTSVSEVFAASVIRVMDKRKTHWPDDGVRGSLHSHGNFFSFKNVATWDVERIYLKAYGMQACTCKCYHQMGVYVLERLVGGKRTTHILNHGFIVQLWHTG
jgi:hypothetical protein